MEETPCVSGVVVSVPKCVLPSTPCVDEAPCVSGTTCAREMACVSERPSVRDSVCEVAVCEGDDGWHAGARSRVSECECHGMVCERRDMQVCVGGMETMTATEGQGPSSGRSYFEHRAGSARQRARGSGCATHEAATCAPAGVKPSPETYAVDVADPATDKI